MFSHTHSQTRALALSAALRLRLLIIGRSTHEHSRSQMHASMHFAPVYVHGRTVSAYIISHQLRHCKYSIIEKILQIYSNPSQILAYFELLIYALAM